MDLGNLSEALAYVAENGFGDCVDADDTIEKAAINADKRITALTAAIETLLENSTHVRGCAATTSSYGECSRGYEDARDKAYKAISAATCSEGDHINDDNPSSPMCQTCADWVVTDEQGV